MLFLQGGDEKKMTKYEMVAQDITNRIAGGEFDDTHKLPIEEELIKHYQVSRNTIRSAVSMLMKEGKVYARQGSGIYIRKKGYENCISITGTNGLTYDFPNSKLETEVTSVELINADEELADKMLCEIGAPVYFVKRVRIIDGKKYALEYTYYIKKIVPYIGKEIASGSIYSYLQNDLGLKFGFADKHISAIKLNKEQAELLELEENDPGLVIADTVYLDNGELFNVSQMIYNYKYANFYAAALR